MRPTRSASPRPSTILRCLNVRRTISAIVARSIITTRVPPDSSGSIALIARMVHRAHRDRIRPGRRANVHGSSSSQNLPDLRRASRQSRGVARRCPCGPPARETRVAHVDMAGRHPTRTRSLRYRADSKRYILPVRYRLSDGRVLRQRCAAIDPVAIAAIEIPRVIDAFVRHRFSRGRSERCCALSALARTAISAWHWQGSRCSWAARETRTCRRWPHRRQPACVHKLRLGSNNCLGHRVSRERESEARRRLADRRRIAHSVARRVQGTCATNADCPGAAGIGEKFALPRAKASLDCAIGRRGPSAAAWQHFSIRTARGRVILVGAGPGDPGLLTVRAVEALEKRRCRRA